MRFLVNKLQDKNGIFFFSKAVCQGFFQIIKRGISIKEKVMFQGRTLVRDFYNKMKGSHCEFNSKTL